MTTTRKSYVAYCLGIAAAGFAGCMSHPSSWYHGESGPTAMHASDTARAGAAGEQSRPAVVQVGTTQTLATFSGPMPTGVSVSHSGRVFVNFPRWGDPVDFTVAEIKDGKATPFPDAAINAFDAEKASDHLISVQSVVVDPLDRLWILDTAAPQMGQTLVNGPKLVCVDLSTNQVTRMIAIPADVALPTTYLNDVRFNLKLGKSGVAFITDSADKGPNGIIVVDLESGQSWRRLNDHPSTKAEKDFIPIVEGQPLLARPGDGDAKTLAMGADGIAISADGKRLFYTPLIGHHWYSVSAEALADRNVKDEEVAKTIVDHGDRGYASDGLECDSAGRLYFTDYEHNAIRRRATNAMGSQTTKTSGEEATSGASTVSEEILVQGPQIVWPDTLSIGPDGFLYFTANQLNRQARFHGGKDLRQKPYLLLRTKVEAAPVDPR